MRPFIVTTHGTVTLFTYLIKLYDEYSPLHEWLGLAGPVVEKPDIAEKGYG
jgi:hypothetical protein